VKLKIFILAIISIVFLTVLYFIFENGLFFNLTDFFLGMATGIFAVTITVWIIVFIVTILRKQKIHNYKNQLLLSAGTISLFTGILLAMHNRSDSIVLFISFIIIVFSMLTNIIYIRKVRNHIIKC